MTPDAALIIIRTFVYVDLLLLFGLAAFGLYGVRMVSEAVSALPLRSLCVWLALAGLVLTVLQLAVMAAAMAGTPLLPINGEHVSMLIGMSGTGSAFVVRFVGLAIIVPLSLAISTYPRATLTFISGSAALVVGTLAWAGHGAMRTGGSPWIHTAGDVVHLLAAGGWLGALVALLIMLFKPGLAINSERIDRLASALRGFSGVGTALVGAILLTGTLNILSVVGWAHLSSTFGGAYGRLLAIKLILFAAMLGLASGNRFWLVPALERARRSGETHRALRALRCSLVVECVCALTILALVAALGLLAPPR